MCFINIIVSPCRTPGKESESKAYEADEKETKTIEKVKGILYTNIRTHSLHMMSFDPLGQPTVTAGGDHCFRTCCLSVHPYFSKSSKTNKFQTKTMFTTNKTVGLAEWIIDYTCLVMH